MTDNPLGYEKISKLLKDFAVPSIMATLVGSIYNIVDQIFIGQGVGYLDPIFIFIFHWGIFGAALATVLGQRGMELKNIFERCRTNVCLFCTFFA